MGNAHGRQHQMPIDGGSLTPNDIYPADAQDFDEKIVQRLIIHRHIAPFYKGAEDPDPPLPNSVGTLSGTGDHGSVSSARGGSNSPGGFEDDAGWWSYSMHVTPKSDDEDAGPITGASEPTSPSVTATQHERRQERLTTRRSAASLQCDGSSSGQHRKSNGLRGLIIKNYHHRRQKSSEGTVARSFVSAAGSADHNAEDASIDELKRKLRRVVECPICFLYYPANINYTRCCHKPICTECFVQIKRNDELLSPANCPYCTVPEFGVIYYPPHLGADGINGNGCNSKGKKQRGLLVGHKKSKSLALGRVSTAISTGIGGSIRDRESAREGGIPKGGRQRSKTVTDYEPPVVMSDDIRPDLIKQIAFAKQRRAREEQQRNVAFANIVAMSGITDRRDRSSGDRGSRNEVAPLISTLSRYNIAEIGQREGLGPGATYVGRRSHARRTRVRIPSEYGGYLAAMRASGGRDLEEYLIQEAIRQSLEEVEANREQQQEVDGNREAIDAEGLDALDAMLCSRPDTSQPSTNQAAAAAAATTAAINPVSTTMVTVTPTMRPPTSDIITAASPAASSSIESRCSDSRRTYCSATSLSVVPTDTPPEGGGDNEGSVADIDLKTATATETTTPNNGEPPTAAASQGDNTCDDGSVPPLITF